MHIELNEDQLMIREVTKSFAKKELIPIAGHLDEECIFPEDVVRQLGELGLMGVAIPETYGGSQMDTLSYVVALEEISRGCASTGVIMSVNNSLVCDPIYKFGSEAIRQRYLVPLASGKKLGCF